MRQYRTLQGKIQHKLYGQTLICFSRTIVNAEILDPQCKIQHELVDQTLICFNKTIVNAEIHVLAIEGKIQRELLYKTLICFNKTIVNAEILDLHGKILNELSDQTLIWLEQQITSHASFC